ncbi:MAG: DASS family sodium-coupled anion symporter [Mediterranea sp.]|nr:DASS family sodium-coupled anion symporter [Mediterranea sp.]
MSASQKKLSWLIAIIVIYFALTMMPTPAGLTPVGQKALSLMLCAVLSWIFVPIPVAISSLFFVFALPLVKVEGMGKALQSFADPTVFFMIASFMFATAMGESGISKRISLKIALFADGSPTKSIMYMMCAAALVSTVISDPPVAAAFTPIALELINRSDREKGKSNFAKALLIGVSMAALIGGVGTPAGSSINVLALQQLEKFAEIKISFLQWTMLGIPFVIFATPLTAIALTMTFRPEIKVVPGIEDIKKEYGELGPMKRKETKFLALMLLLVIVWLTGTFHGLPVPLTATVGAVLFFLPGVDLLTWDTAKNRMGWDIIFLTGTACALATSVFKSGAAEWMASISLSGIKGSSELVVLTIITIFTIVVHFLIPVSLSIVAVMVPALAVFATTSNISAALLVVPVGFTASAAYMLPIDPVALITYSHGYYSMGDFFKGGIGASIVWIIFMVLFMYLIGGVAGLV